ncbi:hypothetical protein DID88_001396 [Monilinia fructigena]|uniref:Uncharacterized protein n=1 Tax=Monilinia fructigena TaxID=38457 RepID=A0A395J2B1_9HELO|nr:hypothetical protein DID88_001396 [Monilinia fructigena]
MGVGITLNTILAILTTTGRPQADLSSPAYVSTGLTWSTTSQADGLFNWKQSDKDVISSVYEMAGYHDAPKEYSTSVLNLSSVAKPKPVRDTPSPVNGLDFTDTIAFPDNPYPLADVFMIYRNWSEESSEPKSPYSAMEFVLEWCVQEFSTLIMNGAVITVRHESTNNFTGGGGYLTGPLFNSTSTFGFASGRPNYEVSNDTHFIMSNYLRKTLNGSIHLQGQILYKTSDAAEAFYQRISIDSGNGNVLNTTTDQAGLAEVVQKYCNEHDQYGTTNRSYL